MPEPAAGGDSRFTAFVKLQGEWAFVGPSPEMLASVPADPTTLLAGLEKKYDLAVCASMKNVPPMFRQMATAQVQLLAEMGMQQMPGESDEEYAVRAKVAREVVDRVPVTLINELDDVLLAGPSIARPAPVRWSFRSRPSTARRPPASSPRSPRRRPISPASPCPAPR